MALSSSDMAMPLALGMALSLALVQIDRWKWWKKLSEDRLKNILYPNKPGGLTLNVNMQANMRSFSDKKYCNLHIHTFTYIFIIIINTHFQINIVIYIHTLPWSEDENNFSIKPRGSINHVAGPPFFGAQNWDFPVESSFWHW